MRSNRTPVTFPITDAYLHELFLRRLGPVDTSFQHRPDRVGNPDLVKRAGQAIVAVMPIEDAALRQ